MRAALFAAVLCAAPLCAAPAPPPPPLTRDLLVGCWHYGYGSSASGFITLSADGTYYASHSPRHEYVPHYQGRWSLEGDEFTLTEWLFGWPEPDVASVYTFKVTNRHYPAVKGTSDTGVALLLTDPRRD